MFSTIVAVALGLALLLPGEAPAAPVAADHLGTVIEITNDTDRSLTFFVEFSTPEGGKRHFLEGKYLKPGDTGRFTAEPEWIIPTRREGGVTYFLIRVRGFRSRLESLQFTDVEKETPDHWWGGSAARISGLKCRDWEADGFTHLSARLHW